MSLINNIEKRIEKTTKDVKDKFNNYFEPKKEDPLLERREQKIRLERLSNIMGLRTEKTRKLTLDFKEQKDSKTYKPEMIRKQKEESKYSQEQDEENDEKKEVDKFSFSNIKKKDYSNYSIKDVISYFKQEGVVGEESLTAKIFLAASNNVSFGVEGFSGSGKTFVVDKLIDLFKEKDLYRLDLSSKMALFYDADNLNTCKTIYIPELQKALQETRSPIVEVVKNLTEGKDVKRIITNDKKNGNKILKINKGKSIIYTLASENYFKKDEELNRRFLRFKTNHSEEHLEEILNYKSNKRQELFFEQKNSFKQELKNYFNYLRNMECEVFDPYISYISEFLPRTQKSIGYIDHYFSLVDASTKFHQENRISLNYEDKKVLVTDIEDHFLIHKIYYKEFMNTLTDFSKNNDFQEEIEIIQELKQRNMDWEKALNMGINTYKEKIGIKQEEIEKLNPKNIQTIKQEYKNIK